MRALRHHTHTLHPRLTRSSAQKQLLGLRKGLLDTFYSNYLYYSGRRVSCPHSARRAHPWIGKRSPATLSDDKASVLCLKFERTVPYAKFLCKVFEHQSLKCDDTHFLVDYASTRRVIGSAARFIFDSPDSSMLDFILAPELIVQLSSLSFTSVSYSLRTAPVSIICATDDSPGTTRTGTYTPIIPTTAPLLGCRRPFLATGATMISIHSSLCWMTLAQHIVNHSRAIPAPFLAQCDRIGRALAKFSGHPDSTTDPFSADLARSSSLTKLGLATQWVVDNYIVIIPARPQLQHMIVSVRTRGVGY